MDPSLLLMYDFLNLAAVCPNDVGICGFRYLTLWKPDFDPKPSEPNQHKNADHRNQTEKGQKKCFKEIHLQ